MTSPPSHLLNERVRGWLRHLWRKSMTPDDWSRDGRSIYYSSAGDLGPSWITEHELASGREQVVFSSDDASADSSHSG